MTERRLDRRGAPLVALAVVIILASCSTGPATTGLSSREQPSASVGHEEPISLRFEIPSAPGPVKPFRGEMTQHVFLNGGQVSMYFELRNVGEEPITFLNTLYDYEPQQLYTPAVRLEWDEGGDAVYTRAGRFFPSPAVIGPGDAAVYIMGGQQIAGSGTPGNLVTHIKYCPTRGMDDEAGIPVEVADVSWRDLGDGTVEVSGTLVEQVGSLRRHAPSVGVAFFNADGSFVGAVVEPADGEPLLPGERRAFTMRGAGVAVAEIAEVRAFAVIP
ncbi:MAG: hypothetical protein ABIQ05_01285 [Candidatus Limnocylindria bacterium]